MEICAKLFGPNLMRGSAELGTLNWSQGMNACSACSGDYEDPDRTQWVTGEGEDEGTTPAEGEEYLAEC